MGAAAIFARYALAGAGPLAVSAARLTIAAGALLVVALLRRKTGDTRPNAMQRTLLAYAGIALALHFAVWIASLDYTTVAVSTLLVATTPIFTAAYDAVVNRRLLSRLSTLAFIAGAIGLVLVVGFDRTAPPIEGHEILGSVLAIAGAIAFAGYLIAVRSVSDALPTRAIVTHTYTWAAVTLVLASFIAHQAPPAFSNASAWGGIVAMALVSQLLGHTALNASLRWFTPSGVSFSTLLEPVSAAVLAFALFRESIAPVAIGGGLVLLGSIAVVLREER